MTKVPKSLSALPEWRASEAQPITIPGTEIQMTGYPEPHPQAPKRSPYRFPESLVQEIAVAMDLGMNVLLTGPTGCGKTSLPVQLAASLGVPCVRFNMDGETRVSHVRGQQRPAAKEGVLTLQFALGQLAMAMREGWWVVLDEIDAALPSVLFVLQPVLEEDERSIRIPETGEKIVAHERFRLFATSNTVGYRAAARARHAGANVMNTAFVDRFGMVLGVDYPTREEEIDRIKLHVPGLAGTDEGLALIDGMCRVAEELRRSDRYRSDFSTRRVIQWARLVASFPTPGWAPGNENGELPYDVMRAAELAVLRKLETPADAKIAREMICRVFAYEES